jgi:hypothetical protein
VDNRIYGHGAADPLKRYLFFSFSCFFNGLLSFSFLFSHFSKISWCVRGEKEEEGEAKDAHRQANGALLTGAGLVFPSVIRSCRHVHATQQEIRQTREGD